MTHLKKVKYTGPILWVLSIDPQEERLITGKLFGG